MMRMQYFLAIISFFIFVRCSTTRTASDSKAPVILDKVEGAGALLEIVKATELPYTWYSAIGQGTIDWEGQRLTAKVNVRIRHDSLIWVQISKLGIEVGRMLITPDSAFFVNRIERTYSRHGTAQFFKKYNLPVDFDMFSKVFTGGAYVPEKIRETRIEPDGALYVAGDNGVDVRHWIDSEYSLMRSHVTDEHQHEWAATYGDYLSVNTGQKFPFQRANTLIMNGEENLFDLDYSSVEVNMPVEFPFSIPSHYEKM